jgi:protein tyrosine phosphatase (PTP) superfamily phosphohydrolase (DUF442 family)
MRASKSGPSARGVDRSARSAARRIPLTITLSPAELAFIESCVSLKQFESVDKFFATVLAHYRKHLQVLNAYAEGQEHKSLSRDEILASIECETVITRRIDEETR